MPPGSRRPSTLAEAPHLSPLPRRNLVMTCAVSGQERSRDGASPALSPAPQPVPREAGSSLQASSPAQDRSDRGTHRTGLPLGSHGKPTRPLTAPTHLPRPTRNSSDGTGFRLQSGSSASESVSRTQISKDFLHRILKKEN